MSRRYRQIMEKVQVTDEMTQRILRNIRTVDPPRPRFRRSQWLYVVAACLAVVIGCASGFYATGHRNPSTPSLMAPGSSGITEAASVQELSRQVGYPLSQLTRLPFSPETIRYTSFRGSLAEITYIGDGGQLSFRQSRGEADNSGDYTPYDFQAELSADAATVTLKGNDRNHYVLALWQADGFSYSIKSDAPISLSEWQSILSGLSR